MKRQFLSLISLLLLIVTLCGLASCGDTAPADDTSAAAVATTAGVTEAPAETEDPDYVDSLPADLNYGGAQINIASSDRDWWADEITVDDLNGETVNDAVYNRNIAVQERLGIKINNIKIAYNADNAHIINQIAKVYSTGDSTVYDVSFANCYQVAMASLKGYFCDLNKIDNIDLTKKYWMQSYNEVMSFHGAQFSATGAISLSSMRFVFVNFFNKRLFDDANIPYPYETVKEGKWTLDYQLSILSALYKDEDGSLSATEQDTFAFISSDMISVDPYWLSLELPILKKNADGDYEYAMDEQKLSDAVDKLIQIYTNVGTMCYARGTNDSEQEDMRVRFSEGKAAIAQIRLIEAESTEFRNMSDKYGIVPVPKYNEDQQEYHSHMHDQFTVVSVLKTVPEDKRAMMGAFLEAMAYQSYKTTMPAYYELSLKGKYQSDAESWEMLDDIMESRDVEAGNLFYSSIGSPHTLMRDFMQAKTNTVSSRLKSMSRTLPRMLKSLNESLTKVAEE